MFGSKSVNVSESVKISEFTISPDAGFRRQSPLTSSMRKLKNKFSNILDRMNTSFSEFREATAEVRSCPSKSNRFRCQETMDNIISSGGGRRIQSGEGKSKFRAMKPKNLFKRRDGCNKFDLEDKNTISTWNSLTSLSALEEHLISACPMETGSGRVLIFNDLKKSIIAVPFSDPDYVKIDSYPTVNSLQKIDYRLKTSTYKEVDGKALSGPEDDAGQKVDYRPRANSYPRVNSSEEDDSYDSDEQEMIRQSRHICDCIVHHHPQSTEEIVPKIEDLNDKFFVRDMFTGGFHCLSKTTFDSRSSNSTNVYPGWSDDNLDKQKSGYAVMNCKYNCANEKDSGIVDKNGRRSRKAKSFHEEEIQANQSYFTSVEV